MNVTASRAADTVQPGEAGAWRIEVFEVDDKAAQWDAMRSLGKGRQGVTPGRYVRLMRGGTVVMSDTPDEMRDLWPILRNGHGRVLVNGLGLGCVVRGLLAKPDVEHIDVVEISEDVISLVGPEFPEERVTIHHGDAFTIQWPAGTRWDAVWHDVWDDLCSDNLSGGDARPGSYATLHRRYGRRTDWQGSWGFEIVRAQKERERGVWWL